MKLVVLAAGKGTRFYPLTNELPKGLIPIGSSPMLEHVLEPYLAGVSDIILVINDDLGHLLRDHFGDTYQGHAMRYVVQDMSGTKGTLGALMSAADLLAEDELFCVCNCDDLLLAEDVQGALAARVPGMGLTRARMKWNYLGISTDGDRITGFRRHAQEEGELVEDLFVNGFYVLTRDVLAFPPVGISGGEAGLPQTLLANLDRHPLRAFAFSRWQSVNGPENLPDAERFVGGAHQD